MTKSEVYYQVSRENVLYQNELHKDFSSRAINLIGYGVAMLAAGAIALNLPHDGIPLNALMVIALALWGGGFVVLFL